MTTPTATWTQPRYNVQHLDVDLSDRGIRQVSVAEYMSGCAIALMFGTLREDPIWEAEFPSIERARIEAERRVGL